MKKIALLLAVQLLVFAGWSLAQGTGARPTPPPISCYNFSPGEKQWSITGIYMKMGHDSTTSKGATGFGFTGDYAFKLPNRRFSPTGAILGGTFMRMNMPYTFVDSTNPSDSLKNIGINYFGGNLTFVFVPINGEMKDIAGEIIERKKTLAFFFGYGLDHYGMNMGPLYQMVNIPDDISMSVWSFSLPMGMVVDVPLNYTVSLVPFARLRLTGMAIDMKALDYQIDSNHNITYSLQDTTYGSGYAAFDYGADIDLRLFRNSPEWVISAGTVLSQVGGLKSGNLQFTLSLKREIGKHYSSTLIGPMMR